jgi:hypothetical protein
MMIGRGAERGQRCVPLTDGLLDIHAGCGPLFCSHLAPERGGVSTAIWISPLAATGTPRGRSRDVPADGHWVSPGTATGTPRGRPVSPWGLGQGHHSFAGEGVGEADGFAVSDYDVGVVHEPVDQGGGDGLVHELVEAGGVQVGGQGE